MVVVAFSILHILNVIGGVGGRLHGRGGLLNLPHPEVDRLCNSRDFSDLSLLLGWWQAELWLPHQQLIPISHRLLDVHCGEQPRLDIREFLSGCVSKAFSR